MTILDDELARTLDPEFGALGFERVRPRRWVSPSNGAIRRLFEFQALKGAQYSARWSFSLDFVPAFRSGRFRWKRTAKTSEFDLSLDRETEADIGFRAHSLTYLPPIEVPDRDRIEYVARETLRMAREDFDRVLSIDDFVIRFEERATKWRARRLPIEFYVQTHLAWGLALVALGRKAEAEAHLKQFCDQFEVDRDDPFLRKAEFAAQAHSENGGNEDRATAS